MQMQDCSSSNLQLRMLLASAAQHSSQHLLHAFAMMMLTEGVCVCAAAATGVARQHLLCRCASQRHAYLLAALHHIMC